jgi:CheY-like chemotaxis protein
MRRILIVDDDAHARELLRMVLENIGYAVIEAADGIAGVALAVSTQPEIAFVDLDLPGLDGLGVAGRLRANEDTRHIYLVALTGRGREQDRRRTREVGFDEHVNKPADLGRLLDLIAARPARHVA